MDNVLPFKVDPNYERRIRLLAHQLAAGIQEPTDVIDQLGFSQDEYQKLAAERVFRELFASALSEWNAAGNTQKRAKLKAAIAVEETIHHLATAITDQNEPLSSRSGAFLALAKVGGLGNPDPIVGGGYGSMFKLEIHMANRVETISVGGPTLESIGELEESTGLTYGLGEKNKWTQSSVFSDQPWQEIE